MGSISGQGNYNPACFAAWPKQKQTNLSPNPNKQKSLRNSYLLNKRINKLSPCLLPISKAQPQTVRVRILLEERGGNVILSDLPKLTGTKTDCDSVGKGLHTIPRKLHI